MKGMKGKDFLQFDTVSWFVLHQFPLIAGINFCDTKNLILFLLVLSLIETHPTSHIIGCPITENCLVNFRAVFVWLVDNPSSPIQWISWDIFKNSQQLGNDTDLKLEVVGRSHLVATALLPFISCHQPSPPPSLNFIGIASHSIYKSILKVKINECQRQQNRISTGS